MLAAPRLRQVWADLLAAFWLRPGLMTLAAILLAWLLIGLEGRVTLPEGIDAWVYSGGVSGARDVLGTIAAAMIGVAGTTFSITVAALTLASNQMGPRLLRNFTRDPGNQYALGALVATFAYALITLRSVQEVAEAPFVPQLAVSVALLLAFACIGVLIWFLHHVAASISVDRVVSLVHADLAAALAALPRGGEAASGTVACMPETRGDAAVLRVPARGGYLRVLDDEALANWAGEQGAVLRLRLRSGDFAFPGSVAGKVWPASMRQAAQVALEEAMTLGETRSAEQDLEFVVRQLVEIALRALSPGINDPFTAVAVLDRLGESLCELAGRRLPDGRSLRHGRICLMRPATTYAGLIDAMFHPVRQAGAMQPVVAIRLLEVLAEVAGVEQDPTRLAELRRHAALARDAACRSTEDASVLHAIADRYAAAMVALQRGGDAAAQGRMNTRR